MSYDLMVFEPSSAPRGRAEFMQWYEKQTQWSEGHSYNDPQVASSALHRCFQEVIQFFPPMNGPLAVDDPDNPRVTDHSIGREVIYSAFAWSCMEEAHATMRGLAIKHEVGFFDVSAQEGEILFPDDRDLPPRAARQPWWRFW
jgi:hypothetical protein